MGRLLACLLALACAALPHAAARAALLETYTHRLSQSTAAYAREGHHLDMAGRFACPKGIVCLRGRIGYARSMPGNSLFDPLFYLGKKVHARVSIAPDGSIRLAFDGYSAPHERERARRIAKRYERFISPGRARPGASSWRRVALSCVAGATTYPVD